ncbi:MAG: type IV pilus modification protein PilV [Halomonadaceae bacterium]|nr:type IV pilus modification protein PilV [Halomonadaceae bacterium]
MGGFTLVEALVALLVLSIGLLGVASMQLKALQSAHVGYQRSIASLAAQDAQEMLWAELADSGALSCPDKTAVNDSAWGTKWGAYLPGLDSDPVGTPTNCEFPITISWNEERFGGGGESFSYTVRLPGE